MTKVTAVAIVLAALSLARAASAQEKPAGERDPNTRSWLYVDDAVVASPLRTIAFSRITYTSSTDAAARPFASDLAHPGAIFEAGAEIGIAPSLSLAASGASDALGLSASPASGMSAGLRFAPFRTLRGGTRVVMSGGYLNELSGNHGVWTKLALARDFGRARVAFSAYGEHVFATMRDAVDLMVVAGVSYRVLGSLRAGVEYVAQDLEGAIDPEEVEGMRHFLGPTLGLELMKERLAITAGPAAGLSAHSPYAVGRAAIAYSF